MDEVTQQLQGLLTQEQTAFIKFLRIAGHEVRTHCLLLHILWNTNGMLEP